MIYVYEAEMLADLKNRSLCFYNEYNLSKNLENLNSLFYFFVHKIYDPIFLWNFPDQNLLTIELGNQRFIGRSLKAQITGEEWLKTKLLSPEPWDLTFSDLKIHYLEKSFDIEFLNYRDRKMTTENMLGTSIWKKVLSSYLASPKLSSTIFIQNTAYDLFIKNNLSHRYILRINNLLEHTLGDQTSPILNVYETKKYGGLIPALLNLFVDAEKEIA